MEPINRTIHFRGNGRFTLFTIAGIIFGAAFGLVLFNCVTKFIAGEPFRWPVFWEYFPNLLLGTTLTAVFSYFMTNHFYALFSTRQPFARFLLPIGGCVVAIEGYNIVVDYLLPLEANAGNPLPLDRQVVGNAVVAVLYLSLVVLLAYVTHLRDVRKKHRRLQQEKLQLEVEKSHAELLFLKSQINPHFLHNTLNSFYARALPLSNDLAEGILTLSEMMRYALGEAYTTDGKVLLKDEVEHLRHLVRIHQFRFRNHLNITLEVSGTLNGAVVIPFVLITLVENIFKHGDLASPDSPAIITIDVQNGALHFFSRNKKKQGPKELSTGIGLANIRKRLHLTYGEGYRLEVNQDEEIYSTELLIQHL